MDNAPKKLFAVVQCHKERIAGKLGLDLRGDTRLRSAAETRRRKGRYRSGEQTAP